MVEPSNEVPATTMEQPLTDGSATDMDPSTAGQQLLAKQSPQTQQMHSGDEGAVDDDCWVEADAQAVRQVSNDTHTLSNQAKNFNSVVLEEMGHIIDAEPKEEVQKILRHTIGWIDTKKTKEIEVNYLAKYLEKQEGENSNFVYLIRVTAFMVVYVVMVLQHEDMAAAGLLQRGIAKRIGNEAFEGVSETAGHKTMFDIDNRADLWLFLKEVILPMFLSPESQNPVDDEVHRVMRYNRLIGGVHLMQRRYRERDCTVAWPSRGPSLQNGSKPLSLGFSCFDTSDGEKMTDDCFGPLHVSVRQKHTRSSLPSGFCADHSPEGLFPWNVPESTVPRRLIIGKSKRTALSKPASIMWYTGLQEYDSDTYSMVFDFEDGGLSSAMKRLQWLKDNDWIDLQTQYIGVRLFVLNPELSMYSHASIGCFFGHSGEIVSMISMTTFRAEPYERMTNIIADLVFFLFLGYNVIEWYVKACSAAANGELGNWCRRGYNWVQAFICHFGLMVLLGWGCLLALLEGAKDSITNLDSDGCRMNVTKTEEELQMLNATPGVNDEILQPDDPLYTACLLKLHENIYSFSNYLQLYRVVLAVYCVVLILRFFKVFTLQPRLAMVVVTLQKCWDPLIHHILIFFMLLAGYSSVSVFLFGRRLGDFATVPISFNTCFRMLFGDFDWAGLTKQDPYTVYLWFYSFTFICALLMVNMFMAIIMDVYVEVKQKAGFTHSAWEQLWIIMKLFVKSRSWVSTPVVMRVLRETFQKPFSGRSVCAKIDADVLVQVIPGMSKMQADFFVEGALERKEAEDNLGVSLLDAVKIVGDIALTVKRMQYQLEAIVAEMKDERDELLEAAAKAAAKKKQQPQPPPESPAPLFMGETALVPAIPRISCSGFSKRALDLETRLQRIAEFVEDITCWQAYRGKEVHERTVKIEAMVQECAELVPGRVAKNIPGIETWQEEPEPLPPALLLGSRRNPPALEQMERETEI